MKRNLSAWLAGLALSAATFDVRKRRRSAVPLRRAFYAPPPIFTWAGFYLGANGGLNFGRFSGGGTNYFNNAFGGLYGITGGYNYQSGPLVVGAEADLDFGSVDGNAYPFGGVHASGNVTGEGSLRGRFGYALDRALLYVTGGYTGASMRGSLVDTGGDAEYLCEPIGLSERLHGRRRFGIRDHQQYLAQSRISVQRLRLDATLQRDARCDQLRPQLLDRKSRRELSLLSSPAPRIQDGPDNRPGRFLWDEARRRKGGNFRLESGKPIDEIFVSLAPNSGEAQIEIAERAGKADMGDVALALRRRGLKHSERAGNFFALIVLPFRLAPLGRTKPLFIDLQKRRIENAVATGRLRQASQSAPWARSE